MALVTQRTGADEAPAFAPARVHAWRVRQDAVYRIRVARCVQRQGPREHLYLVNFKIFVNLHLKCCAPLCRHHNVPPCVEGL